MTIPSNIARVGYAGLSIVILASSIPYFVTAEPNFNGFGGADYQLYMDATHRWLSGGPFYQPYQLLGPYAISFGAILYPPVALWLFVPFTVIPAPVWWAVPIALTVWAVVRLRPPFIVWPLLAICLASPPTVIRLITGNPVIWAMAAVAVGVTTTGPAVFALIKPSLAPFALWGIRHRRWWAYLAIFIGLSLPFGSMWLDWITAVVNSQGGGGLAYSFEEAPMLALPIVAWAGARYRKPSMATDSINS